MSEEQLIPKDEPRTRFLAQEQGSRVVISVSMLPFVLITICYEMVWGLIAIAASQIRFTAQVFGGIRLHMMCKCVMVNLSVF